MVMLPPKKHDTDQGEARQQFDRAEASFLALRSVLVPEQDFVHWLLNTNTPSIRYLTLRHLLGRPEADTDVRPAWREMQTTGPIPAILAEQAEAGHWAGERSYYTPKYISTTGRSHQGVPFMKKRKVRYRS